MLVWFGLVSVATLTTLALVKCSKSVTAQGVRRDTLNGLAPISSAL